MGSSKLLEPGIKNYIVFYFTLGLKIQMLIPLSFVFNSGGHILYLLVYVDDLIITWDNLTIMNRFVHLLRILACCLILLVQKLYPINMVCCFLNAVISLIFLLALTCLMPNQCKHHYHQIPQSRSTLGLTYLILQNFELLWIVYDILFSFALTLPLL